MDTKKRVSAIPSKTLEPKSPGSKQAEDQIKHGNKAERQQAALNLWNKWAEDALGPLSSEPKPEELETKTARFKRLERECAELAANCQQRLEASTRIKSAGGNHPRVREQVLAVREKSKQAIYNKVKGVEPADAASAAEVAAGIAAGSIDPVTGLSYKSHGMLEALLSGQPIMPVNTNNALAAAAATALARRGGNAGGAKRSASASGARPSPRKGFGVGRPATATAQEVLDNTRKSMGRLLDYEEREKALAMRGAASRPQRPLDFDVPGSPLSQHAGESSPLSGLEAESSSVGAQISALKEQLDAQRDVMQSQTDLEDELRDTIALLRARLHTASQREVEHQRRINHAARLGPLFDRLAERFTFKSPEEVVDRLEFLEDDKLGTFDQLIRAQEEVHELQARLNEATKRVEVVKTQMTTEHITGTASLQAQNETLRGELESMQVLVDKLNSRQGELVRLQSAVMDLWSRCQLDPQFNTSTSGLEGERLEVEQPQTMVATIQEYLIQHSPVLAVRHLLDIQKVANRVWSQHFSGKEELKGRVVEVFEQLSGLTEVMAAQISSVQGQLKTSRSQERQLADKLQRLEVRKRQLEAEIDRHNSTILKNSGVPRAQRAPTSPLRGGRADRSPSTASPATASPPHSPPPGRAPVPALALGRAGLLGAGPAAMSELVRLRTSAAAHHSSRDAGPRPQSAPTTAPPPRSSSVPRPSTAVPPDHPSNLRAASYRVADLPRGPHWRKHSLGTTPGGTGSRRRSASSMSEKVREQVGAWMKPDRHGFEASFLTR